VKPPAPEAEARVSADEFVLNELVRLFQLLFLKDRRSTLGARGALDGLHKWLASPQVHTARSAPSGVVRTCGARKACEAEPYHPRIGQEASACQARKAVPLPVQDSVNPIFCVKNRHKNVIKTS
jgi:hypothetical protein